MLPDTFFAGMPSLTSHILFQPALGLLCDDVDRHARREYLVSLSLYPIYLYLGV